MKKLTAVVALIAILSCSVVFSAAAEEKVTDRLVAAWDFEGIAEGTPLKNKAAPESAADMLTVRGSVTVENGIATISGQKGSYLELRRPSEKLQSMGEYTVYLKVRQTGEYQTNWVNVMDAGQASKFFLNADTAGEWRIGGPGAAVPIQAFTKNMWHYYAVSVTLDGAQAKYTVYHSTNGTDYTVSSKSRKLTTESFSVTNIKFGACNDDGGISLSYDDIMIFDTALTEGEVKTISTIKVSRDRVGLVGMQRQNQEDGTYHIRFVSVIDSLDYRSIGYRISVFSNGEAVYSTDTACKTVYHSIYSMDYEKTATELGGQYIFALGIRNVDLTEKERAVFRVTPYYQTVDGATHDLSTAEFTYQGSELISSVFVTKP